MVPTRGNPKLDQVRNDDTTEANKKRKTLADDHARVLVAALMQANKEGIKMPYGNYAEWLNDAGYSTRRGNPWTGRTVSRLFKKLGDPTFVKTLEDNRALMG